MLRPVYLLMFKIFGWRIVGDFPHDLKKFVVTVAPHTSNWDFVVGVAARSILRMQHTRFLGKSQLFGPPFGWFFRALGGIPVERSQHHDMVAQVASIIKSSDTFVLALAPEGTRKKVDKLRTGFYYIAKAANVPIIPVGFDFQKKAVIIGEPLYLTSIEKDIPRLLDFYRSVIGRNRELGITDQVA